MRNLRKQESGSTHEREIETSPNIRAMLPHTTLKKLKLENI